MTIQDDNAYLRGVWDWAMFRGCFGDTRIEPTDIDGFVERRGKFLVLEAKSPGVPVKDGQMITFRKLAKTGLFSVLVMWGEKDNPQKALLITRRGEFPYDTADKEKCRRIVAAWFDFAEKF